MYMSEHHTQKFPTYNSARYAYAIHLLSEAVEKSSPHDTTCCEGWNVIDVIEHAEMVLSMVDNINREDSSKGDQPATGTFIAKLKDEIEQRYTQDDLNQQVASPFGDMTLDEFLGIIWIDTFTHAWDIADASSVDHGIPSEMAIEAYKIMQPRSESMRGPGRFNDPYTTTSDDAVEQFMAFAGRTSVNATNQSTRIG